MEFSWIRENERFVNRMTTIESFIRTQMRCTAIITIWSNDNYLFDPYKMMWILHLFIQHFTFAYALKRDDTPAHPHTFTMKELLNAYSVQYIIFNWAGSKWIVIIIHFLSYSYKPYVANTVCGHSKCKRAHTHPNMPNYTPYMWSILCEKSLFYLLVMFCGIVETNSWCHSIVRNHSQLIALMSPISFG